MANASTKWNKREYDVICVINDYHTHVYMKQAYTEQKRRG